MKWWLEEDVWERDDLSFLKRWAIFIGIIQEERKHNHESEKSVERIIGGITEDSNERAGGHGWAGV